MCLIIYIYICVCIVGAGVDLSATLRPMHPKKLYNTIITQNESVFNNFLNFPKPIIIAVNGPAIGASVTTATLCDAILASEKATFITPFARLGLCPEGCSSVHFKYLMGEDAAKKMLDENYTMGAEEAERVGLVTSLVPHNELQSSAQSLAEKWIKEGKHLLPRTAMGYTDLELLKRVNHEESIQLATAFLSVKFLQAQYNFLSGKGKTKQALVFRFLLITRPLWSMML
jgi:enoyl-CoA hydratase/carnithine racemase